MTEQRYVAHGLVEADGRLLLLQRREGRYLGGYWDIPGGTVEPDESPAGPQCGSASRGPATGAGSGVSSATSRTWTPADATSTSTRSPTAYASSLNPTS